MKVISEGIVRINASVVLTHSEPASITNPYPTSPNIIPKNMGKTKAKIIVGSTSPEEERE